MLAKPEFDGMWDAYKPYKPPRSDIPPGPTMPGASKMDRVRLRNLCILYHLEVCVNNLLHVQEIMERVLNRHREGIVVKQVAAGREFQGTAFYSKPDVIHFKVRWSSVLSLQIER